MPDELLARGDSIQFAEIQAHFRLQEDANERIKQAALESAEAEKEERSQGRPGG